MYNASKHNFKYLLMFWMLIDVILKEFRKRMKYKDLIVQLVGSSYNWKIKRNAGRILCSGVDYDFLSKFEVII